MLLEALLLTTQLDNSRIDTDLYTFYCLPPDPIVVTIKDLVETLPTPVNSSSFLRATVVSTGLFNYAVTVAEDTLPTLAKGEGGSGTSAVIGSETGQWHVAVSKSAPGAERYSLEVKCAEPGGLYEPTR